MLMLVLQMIAVHDQTGRAVLVGKKLNTQRRAVSKLQQLVYEIGKFVGIQSGKGVKEDQKGHAFMRWCLLNDMRQHYDVHRRMKPVVGSRYFVYHYNPRIIFKLRQVYLDFIEHVKQTKAKPGLNRLEASIKKLLQDEQVIAQMRAAAILCEQIEQPILWMSKANSALAMRQVLLLHAACCSKCCSKCCCCCC